MGSELSAIETAGGQGSRIWLNLLRIALGQIDRLSLASGGGGSGFEVRATGILKSYYGDSPSQPGPPLECAGLLVRLAEESRRRGRSAPDRDRPMVRPDSPVHLVAHSMGGLVCRTFIKRHADRWKTMWDGGGNGERGGRLVMLGTPNYGSYLILQAAAAWPGTIRKLAMIDQRHDTAEHRPHSQHVHRQFPVASRRRSAIRPPSPFTTPRPTAT